MRFLKRVLTGLLLLPLLAEARLQWTTEQANTWYAKQPWFVGSNFIPKDAINQLEMWQADTFNPKEIDWELGLAEQAGINTMRVFLQDQLWSQDRKGFTARLNTYLELADKHHIKTLLVLFDSCWDPHPKLGKQPLPKPGLHNSGWVQSPGIDRLSNPAFEPELKTYVQGVISSFAKDERVLGWDLWYEPHEGATDDIHKVQDGKLVTALLPKVYAWARAANPSQPLTSGVFDGGDWSPKAAAKLTSIQQIQLSESDILSFHSYAWPEEFENRIQQLTKYGRPLLCTEYMARGSGSTIDGSLPVGKQYGVGMYNWGFVDGKTQTRLPWDSYNHPYTDREPVIWFHDLFHADGTPYRQREIDTIRKLMAE